MKKILIIEDAPETLIALQMMLESSGYVVTTATTATAGYETALATKPDLLLCDIKLGGASGFDLLRQLRGQDATALLPIILMTGDAALSRGAGARWAMEQGADDFLRKPFSQEDLLRAIGARLRQQEAISRQTTRVQDCLGRILEATVDVVLLAVTDSRRLIHLNPAGQRLFGLTPAQLASGVSLEDILTPTAASLLLAECLPTIRDDRIWQGELSLLSVDGHEVPVSVVVLGHKNSAGQHEMISVVAHDIKRRKSMEASLRQSELYQKSILSALQAGLVIADAATQEIVDMNDWILRCSGWSKAALLGRPLALLLGPQQSGHHRSEADPGSGGVDTVLHRADGSSFPVLASAIPFSLQGRKCVLQCITDISKQKRMEDSLRSSENRFRSIATASFDAIVMIDPEERISFWNEAASRIFGHAATEAIGEILHDLIVPERFRASARLGFNRFLKTGQGDALGKTLDLVALRKDGTEFPIELSLSAVRLQDQWHGIGIVRDVTERKKAESQLRLAYAAVEAAANGIVITDIHGTIIWVNQAFSILTGYSRDEAIGHNPRVLKSGSHGAEFYGDLWRTISSGQVWRGELVNRRKDESLYSEEMTITPVRLGDQVTHFIAIKQDITNRKQLEAERQRIEIQLRQSHKLESIGQLAAGVAHEINTPMQFVSDNVRFVQQSLPQISRLIQALQDLTTAGRNGQVDTAAVARTAELLRSADVDYLMRELPVAVSESLEGIDRVTAIVRAMKEFSHPSSQARVTVDLNHAIETTVTVARNEWKYVADVEFELDPTLPPVPCYAGEFNQVLLNLVVNAAHAIGEATARPPGAKGRIAIRSLAGSDWVEVQVADNGMGIPEDIRERIYDPFFTTKEVGKGTGQGLALAHNTVVVRHGGSLRFETEVGRGTTFFVRLPLSPPSAEMAAAS
jgi:PAS domain S-box-containing protein